MEGFLKLIYYSPLFWGWIFPLHTAYIGEDSSILPEMFGEPRGKTIERTIKCSIRIFGAIGVGLEWSPFVVLISVTQKGI